MKISTLFYTIKQGFINIFRNKWFSLASIATIGACLPVWSVLFGTDELSEHCEDCAGRCLRDGSV